MKNNNKDKALVTKPIKNTDKKSKSSSPELDVLKGWLSFAETIVKPRHWDFFVIDQFLRGNQDIRGSVQDNSITVTPQSDSLNFPINKLWSNFRAVRSFVTRNKPVVKIQVDDFSEEAKAYSRRANALLERDDKLNNSRKLDKEWVYYGVKYGVGYRQVGYDPVKKVSIRWTIDPMDLLIVSKTGKFEDAPALIKPIVRTIAYWKNKYPKSKFTPDNLAAYDEYKRLGIELNQVNTGGTLQREDEQTAVGFECWYRLFEPNSMGGLVNKCLFNLTEVVDTQETPYKEYPFVAYEADITPNEPYPEGHLKHTIPAQRMLNLLNTQLLEYNHIVNRGRFQTVKGAGFENIFAKEGQIVRVNQGKPLTALTPPPVNPMLQWQINYADDAIKVIGSQNDASRGTNPTGVTSGVALQSLQSADSNNISDLRDNFEDARAKEAQLILSMYNLFEKDGFTMSVPIKNDQIDRFAVVGESYVPVENNGKKQFLEDNGSYLDYLSVSGDNNVSVSVTSELGETKEARLDLLIKLVQLGMPLKFLFEFLELPNGDEIVERIADENIAEIMQQQMQATMGGQMNPQQGQPQQGVNPNDIPVPLPQ